MVYQWLRFGQRGNVAHLLLRESVNPTDAAHDVGRVLKAASRDEANLRPRSSEKRVGSNRAAVRDAHSTPKQIAYPDL